jgi:hypothetical protein
MRGNLNPSFTGIEYRYARYQICCLKSLHLTAKCGPLLLKVVTLLLSLKKGKLVNHLIFSKDKSRT